MTIKWNPENFLRALKTTKPDTVEIRKTDGEKVILDTSDKAAGRNRNRWALVLESLQAVGEFSTVTMYDGNGAALRIIPAFDLSEMDEETLDDAGAVEAPVYSREPASATSEEARIERIMAIQLQAQGAALDQHYKLLKLIIDGFSELAKLNTERQTRIERMQADSVERLISAIQLEAQAGNTGTLEQIVSALGPALAPMLLGGSNTAGNGQAE